MQSSVKELFQHLADTLTFQLGWDKLSLDLNEAELMQELEYGRDDGEETNELPTSTATAPTSTLHH